MVRIHNNEEFWEELHNIEASDPDFFKNVGQEDRLNHYIDDGNPEIDVHLISQERRQLERIREKLGLVSQRRRAFRSPAKRDSIRLVVTYYRKFGLNYHEIADEMNIPYSTLRHDYPELKKDEQLHNHFAVELQDKFGKHLSPDEL